MTTKVLFATFLIKRFRWSLLNDYWRWFFALTICFFLRWEILMLHVKFFFACFSVIFDANNRDKLKKRATNRASREKNVEICRDRFEKSRADRAKREKNVNVLKAFINDFLSDVVTFLKSSNEIDLMLKFKT